MGGRAREHRRHRGIAQWEIDLVQDTVRWAVQNAAADADITDPAALESDLMLHLLGLKRRRLADVRCWEAYLKKALRNKVRNWIRDHPSADQDASLDAPIRRALEGEGEPATLLNRLSGAEPDLDVPIRLRKLLEDCDPWLLSVYKVLLQTDGNLTGAAIRLRVHRNTIRAAVRRIVQLLKHHEFGDRR